MAILRRDAAGKCRLSRFLVRKHPSWPSVGVGWRDDGLRVAWR